MNTMLNLKKWCRCFIVCLYINVYKVFNVEFGEYVEHSINSFSLYKCPWTWLWFMLPGEIEILFETRSDLRYMYIEVKGIHMSLLWHIYKSVLRKKAKQKHFVQWMNYFCMIWHEMKIYFLHLFTKKDPQTFDHRIEMAKRDY